MAGYVAVILVALGLSPVWGSALRLIPRPVLGGATFVLFGSIAVAGIRILAAQPLRRKEIFVVALALGCGPGVAMVPEVLAPLPASLVELLKSPITTSVLLAIALTHILPGHATGDARSVRHWLRQLNARRQVGCLRGYGNGLGVAT